MSATARILRGSRSGAATAFRTKGAARTMSALAPTDTFVGEYEPWWRCAYAAPHPPPHASAAHSRRNCAAAAAITTATFHERK